MRGSNSGVGSLLVSRSAGSKLKSWSTPWGGNMLNCIFRVGDGLATAGANGADPFSF